MANSYNWQINAMDCYPEHDGHQDVVFTVHWRCNGSDGNGHDASVYSTVLVTLDASSDFTPYANLTEAQVIGWVESALGEEQVDAIKRGLDKQISDLITPPVVTPQLPWVA